MFMKPIHIIFMILGGVIISPIAAQESKNNTENSGAKKFEHDFNIIARLQVRAVWAGSSAQKDRTQAITKLVGAEENTNHYDFNARRIRLGIKGTINKHWLYIIDFKGENLIEPGTEGKGGIQEAAIGYKWDDPLRIRIGSNKIPFTREQMTSSSSLITMEKSLITNEIGHQFDIGLTLDGRLLSKVLYYGVGIYNGNGGFANGETNGLKSNSPFFSTRLQYDPFGEYKNGKSMFSDEMLLSLGFGANYQNLDENKNKNHWSVTSDIIFNFAGINVQAAYFHSSNSERGTRNSIYGYYGQAAYFIWQKMIQGWIRYEAFHDDSLRADLNKTQYLSLGLNFYFIEKHTVKLQLAYYLGLNTGFGIGDIRDDWFGTQMQINF